MYLNHPSATHFTFPTPLLYKDDAWLGDLPILSHHPLDDLTLLSSPITPPSTLFYSIQAMRDWVTNVRDTHYIIGSAIGAHPFPTIVRDFQSVIGKESRAQLLEKAGKLPVGITIPIPIPIPTHHNHNTTTPYHTIPHHITSHHTTPHHTTPQHNTP